MDNTLLKILEAKENRWNQRVSLATTSGKTVICVTMCVPYEIRTNKNYKHIYNGFILKFIDYFKKINIEIIPCKSESTDDGEYTLFTCNETSTIVKEATVKAEETIIGGRLFDIDVMDKNGEQISRADIKVLPRSCIICNENAFKCILKSTHKKEEVVKKVIMMFETIIEDDK